MAGKVATKNNARNGVRAAGQVEIIRGFTSSGNANAVVDANNAPAQVSMVANWCAY